MKKREQSNTSDMDGVNLIISILVCYPEIGTLNLDPTDDSLKMTFVLNKKPEDEALESAKDLIRKSILAYHMLEGLGNAIIMIKTVDCGDMLFLDIIRDVESLSRGEIALISEIMKERFGENLISDADLVQEDEHIVQEDFIDNMIGNMKINHAAEKLIGIREDGRVLVFNK